MAGWVVGKHFSDVVSELLAHSDAAPAIIASHQLAIAEVDPAAELPWDRFTATVAELARTVPGPVLVECGARIVRASQAEFERWGFDTADKVLADWDAPFGASIIDAPEHQAVQTLEHGPGLAYLRAGAILPAALIEGYIRGVVAMYGADLITLDCHRVAMEGHPVHLFELRYRSGPPRRHPMAPRNLRGLAPPARGLGMSKALG